MAKMMNVGADEAVKTTQGFGYTSVSIDKLGASEYTIVQIVVDQTGSVSGFKTELEKMIQTVVEACKRSPRAVNLLIRVTAFDAEPFSDRVRIDEIHGFTILDSIDTGDYIGKIEPHGATPLWEASMEAIDTVFDYSETLYNKEYFCNGIVFIITDGENNVEKNATPEKIKQKLSTISRNEKVIESLRTILIGVNIDDDECKEALENFKKDANLDQFEAAKDATPESLAKIADFVSQSVSSQSDSLGSGGPSQPVTDFQF